MSTSARILCLMHVKCRSLPNMSDDARKRTLADWVVKAKKQVVKLYAVAKWARDADAVQKCMVRDVVFVLTDVTQPQKIALEYHFLPSHTKPTI